MSNFTKGPWSAKGPDISAVSDRTRIASCGITQNYADNARLIAAAPELLDAVCKAIPFIEDHESSNAYKPGVVSAVVRELKALVAQVEG